MVATSNCYLGNNDKSTGSHSVPNGLSQVYLDRGRNYESEMKILFFSLSLMALPVYRVGHPICRKVLKIMFWKFLRLIGWYCSYLLPRQALATHMEKHNKTLRQRGGPALYNYVYLWLCLCMRLYPDCATWVQWFTLMALPVFDSSSFYSLSAFAAPEIAKYLIVENVTTTHFGRQSNTSNLHLFPSHFDPLSFSDSITKRLTLLGLRHWNRVF